ncbi:MAG: ABC transporter ATP-binding protein [Herpetosiphonaceae bacterium]|nr:MAG: ABC transporter ATP-binding protein [Herpetosiphonaceae bacterium]
MSATISARDVHKIYKTGKVEVHALRGLTLEIERGEMVAIMGPSGCGKTTLLNCLSGLDVFDQGEILIEGTSLKDMSDRERTAYRAQRMGFVFQFYNLLPVLSAVENVELPLLVSGVRPKEARMRALEWLDRVGLSKWAHHRPAELSGGQRQRVTIARALANSPAIVWADEPTGDLDSETADEVMALLKQLNQDLQQTFVIVTHDQRIGRMCDRIVFMRDGQVVGVEPVQPLAGDTVAAVAR